MVCGTCGYNNADTALYCSNCGAPLKTDSYCTTVDDKFNTQNSFYVQDDADSGNKTEELSNSYPQNNSSSQDRVGMQNGIYLQNSFNGQSGTYPQSGMNGQNGMYSQNGMNGMYPQNAMYPQNGLYPNNNGYNQNGCGAQGNYYPQNNVDDLDSLLGANKTLSNRMKKSDFMKLPALMGLKKKVSGSAITIYVLTALSAAFSISLGNYWVILDYIFLIILAVIIQLIGSLVASYMLLVYGIVNSIICIFEMGFPAGFGYIVAGIYAVIATNKLHKAYKEYVKTGYIPNNMVM